MGMEIARVPSADRFAMVDRRRGGIEIESTPVDPVDSVAANFSAGMDRVRVPISFTDALNPRDSRGRVRLIVPTGLSEPAHEILRVGIGRVSTPNISDCPVP